MGASQVAITEVSPAEVRVRQIRFSQPCSSQADPGEICISQVGSHEVRVFQRNPSQVRRIERAFSDNLYRLKNATRECSTNVERCHKSKPSHGLELLLFLLFWHCGFQ